MWWSPFVIPHCHLIKQAAQERWLSLHGYTPTSSTMYQEITFVGGKWDSAWVKPTHIMTMSHWYKWFPFQSHLHSQLFHYCPALSFCQHKKYHHEVKCAGYPHKCILSGGFTAVNLTSHSPHFRPVRACIQVPGNPVHDAVACTGGGKRW